MDDLKVTAWILMVGTLSFFILFLLSIPSITQYCEQDKTAWFGINIWKNESCEKYWKEIEKANEEEYIQKTYNLSIP